MSTAEPPAKRARADAGTTASSTGSVTPNSSPARTGQNSEITVNRSDEGNAYIDIANSRRVTIKSFKSKIFIDIREFYAKGDKVLPGKKGISLDVQQYKKLKEAILQGVIDKEIEALEH